MIKNINISQLEVNKGQLYGLPKNPRFIRDERFEKLKKSISEAPEMLELRELLVYPIDRDKYIIIGGNMRYRACIDLGYNEIPCKVIDKETSVQKLREYTIKDNEGFGETDWEALIGEWDMDSLESWGVELEDFNNNELEEISQEKPKKTKEQIDDTSDDIELTDEQKEDITIRDVIYESNNQFEIPNLLLSQQANKLELPFAPWGASSRLNKNVSTYHFYVDDYRFNKIFKDPTALICSGVKNIVEPNCSLHDQTPIAYGLHLIYKKRWIARYCQDLGIKVYVDLNVSPKFAEFNKLGIPEGYNAFFTRGISYMGTSFLKRDLEVAKAISGLDNPNLLVYGGGIEAKEFCMKNSLLYVQDFINDKKF